MSDEFLSLTELGQQFGISSHKMGRLLMTLGLRTKDKKPSSTAFQGGFVTQRASTQPGTYYWVWHGEKTMQLLHEAGYQRLSEPGAINDETANGSDRHVQPGASSC
jgi:hypothetical protein